MPNLIPVEQIASKIYLIRGQKVMLDRDLAKLYKVSTGRLNEQVKRNKKRFPEDFAFQLTREEATNLISQFATSRWGGARKSPYVFTEQGVAMLSSVLNSDRAIEVNIQIMRAFVKIRQYLATHKELAQKITEHDAKITYLFDEVGKILARLEKPIIKEIPGFRP